MAENATGRDSDKFMLRFPDGMRDRLKEAAAANGRSMNAEIVGRLDESFIDPSRQVLALDANHYQLKAERLAADLQAMAAENAKLRGQLDLDRALPPITPERFDAMVEKRAQQVLEVALTKAVDLMVDTNRMTPEGAAETKRQLAEQKVKRPRIYAEIREEDPDTSPTD